MNAKLAVEIDVQKRLVYLSEQREIDVIPQVLVVPFMQWKDITAGILQAEVAAETASQKAKAAQRVTVING